MEFKTSTQNFESMIMIRIEFPPIRIAKWVGLNQAKNKHKLSMSFFSQVQDQA